MDIRGVTIHVFVLNRYGRHGSVHGFTRRMHGIKLNKTGVRINYCNAELMLDPQSSGTTETPERVLASSSYTRSPLIG